MFVKSITEFLNKILRLSWASELLLAQLYWGIAVFSICEMRLQQKKIKWYPQTESQFQEAGFFLTTETGFALVSFSKYINSSCKLKETCPILDFDARIFMKHQEFRKAWQFQVHFTTQMSTWIPFPEIKTIRGDISVVPESSGCGVLPKTFRITTTKPNRRSLTQHPTRTCSQLNPKLQLLVCLSLLWDCEFYWGHQPHLIRLHNSTIQHRDWHRLSAP